MLERPKSQGKQIGIKLNCSPPLSKLTHAEAFPRSGHLRDHTLTVAGQHIRLLGKEPRVPWNTAGVF